MRFAGWLRVSIALAFPVAAQAQTVTRGNLLGAWYGSIELPPDSQEQGRKDSEAARSWRTFMQGSGGGSSWLGLWADGLWWFSSTYSHGGGRWRLAGDTLWLGDDWRYGRGGLFQRTDVVRGDTVDTLKMPLFVKYLSNDPHFWIANTKQRAKLYKRYYKKLMDSKNGGAVNSGDDVRASLVNSYWNLSAYKISLKDQQLTLVRLDSLSNNTWLPAKWVLDFKGKDTPVPSFFKKP